MAKFAYNNAKNASNSYIAFKFNYKYYPRILVEEDVDSQFRLILTDDLSSKLQKLVNIYCKNLFRA